MNTFLLMFLLLFAQERTLTVTSPDFENDGEIPSKFTCDGKDINPTFNVDDLPQGTKSIAIMMEDPDNRSASMNYWIVWNLKPTGVIEEATTAGIRGRNSLGKTSYQGPCPAAGTHRYFFKVYALKEMLTVPEESDRWMVLEAMKENVLAEGEMMGWYRKK